MAEGFAEACGAVGEMDAVALGACAVHHQVAGLCGEAVGVGQYPPVGVGQVHGAGEGQKEGVAAEGVAAAEVVDAAGQGQGLLYISHHVPHVGDAAAFVCGGADNVGFAAGVQQVEGQTGVLPHAAVGEVVHPCQAQADGIGQVAQGALLGLELVAAIDVDGLEERVFGERTGRWRAVIYLVARHEEQPRADGLACLGHAHRALHVDAV